MDNIRDDEWIGLGDLKKPTQTERPVRYDEDVSKIVGYPIRVNDPRLIKLVANWRKRSKKDHDDFRPDNFLLNPERIKELKAAFNI